jgi:hypothetical protein
MIGRGARLRVVAVLLVAAGVVAGCRGGGLSPPTSTGGQVPAGMSTGRAVTSAEPGPEQLAEPIRPAVLDEPPGPAGAEAAARYFWDLYGYAMATGHVDALTALSAPDCEYCTAVLTDVQVAGDAGSVVGDAQITVEDATVVELRAGEHYGVDLTTCEPAANDGRPVATRWGMELLWQPGWRVAAVGVQYEQGPC